MTFGNRKSKVLFSISLAVANLTRQELARRLKCDHSMITRILSGERSSERLEKELAQFIELQLRKLRIILEKEGSDNQEKVK